jgi:hypothetical protein
VDTVKSLSHQTFLGQQGVNLIERRVQDMGYWWYPSTVSEVGIDGHIEIRDSQTGRMANLILQVQSRATERRWSRENDTSFDYICEEDELQYWLAGTAEVLLVTSRPSKEEAYWAPVKEYFSANPQNREARRISFSKETGRFDKDAARALLRLAAPKDAGAYLSPRPKAEKLYSNLLKVAHYAPDLYIAQTDLREPKHLWARAKDLGVEVGAEYYLSDGNIASFHDLARDPWRKFCDAGTIEQHETVDWTESDDPNRQRQFVRILNGALKERLKEWNVRQRRDGTYYFSTVRGTFRPRRIDFSGSVAEQFRTVVQKYPSGKMHYIRHTAFNGYFKKMAGHWYLEITPSYVFTMDGHTPSKFEGELLSGIKMIEHNDAVLGQVHLWTDILTRQADLVHRDYPFLRFSELLSFDLDYGINDKEWLYTEDLDVAENGLDALNHLPLFQ